MRERYSYIRQGYVEIAIVCMLWFYCLILLLFHPGSRSLYPSSKIRTCLSGYPSSYPHNSKLPFSSMIDLPFGLAFIREYFIQHHHRVTNSFVRVPVNLKEECVDGMACRQVSPHSVEGLGFPRIFLPPTVMLNTCNYPTLPP